MDIKGEADVGLQTGTGGDTGVTQNAARGGAADALELLYCDIAPLLRAIAIAKFEVPSHDADELIHAVFATYLVNPANVRDVRRYLIGGICHASRQYRRERLAATFIDVSDDFEIAVADDTENLLLSQALGATLARLSDRCRETLYRYYVDGESTAEIARSGGTSTSYILNVLHTCRKRARDIYREITQVS